MEFEVKTKYKIELQDITSQINQLIPQLQLTEHCETITLFIPHTTAAITINEISDPYVITDLQNAWKKLVPQIPYQHLEGNSPAHFLSSIIGTSITVPIKKDKLDLGTWQGIFFCEFDGPRTRIIKLLR